MGIQIHFQRKYLREAIEGQSLVPFEAMRGVGVDTPDTGVVVGGAGCKVADVGGEKYASYVGGVGLEGGYGYYGCDVAVLDHAPDKDVALGERRRFSFVGDEGWGLDQ